MKTLKTLVLFLAAAMFIVACGTTDPVNGDPDPTTGTLTVNVTDSGGDPLTATIVVTDSDGDEVDSQIDSSFTWTDVPVGTYSVRVSATGYQSATQATTIAAGSTSTLAFQLASVDTTAGEGALFVSVSDGTAPLEATIVVTDADGDEVDTQVASSYLWENVAAGTYTVSVSASDYRGQSQEVFVPGGSFASAMFTLVTEVDAEALGDVGFVQLSIEGADHFYDVDGAGYTALDEINLAVPDKAKLIVAQTEEMVGVRARVVEADGETPVANAPVTVSITGDFSSALAIYPGSPVDVDTLSAQTFQGLKTDAGGWVYFTIEATNASLSVQDIMNALLGSGIGAGEGEVALKQALDFPANVYPEPTKLIVSAVGGDNIAKRSEFKAWFTNMSHLWYGELLEEASNRDGFEFEAEDFSTIEQAEQRYLKYPFGEIPNIWDTEGDNTHSFGTYAVAKQPTSEIFPVGVGVDFDDDGNAVYLDWDTYLFSGFFPGYMRYSFGEGTSTDANGNLLVEWVECDVVTADNDCLVSSNWEGIGVAPVAGVGLEDLPISAEIIATYVFVTNYGKELYEFELKDYTFTKTWVGGFLEVDKYVDQHVLTWYGPEVTLAQSNLTFEGAYTSTVFVTVSNPSQSTMYNVTVRDGVPAELGVVEGTISDAGTYDADNHTISWNNVTELQTLEPGESVTVDFEVYARHKPGYCWEGVGDGSFVVRPWGDLVDDLVCDRPYNDPYRVVNGIQQNSVTAAAFFTPDVAGEQLVFAYTPVADESDIWVVRPLFTLEKTRKSTLIMVEGAAATFEIKVGHRDRVSTVVDDTSTEYTFLSALYPWEFEGALGTGTGHEAPSSSVRDNPYARDIQVHDSFEVGLDFTQGIDFDGSLIPSTSGKVVGKDVTFAPIPSLSRGDSVLGQVTLQGNLASDDGDGNSLNNAQFIDSDPDSETFTDGLYAWLNCAYLAAPQLNQPWTGDSVFDGTIYATGTYPTRGTTNLWLPDHFQVGDMLDPTDLVFDATEGATDFTRVPTHADGSLEDCAPVVVRPGPELEPFMTLTTNGEFDEVGIDPVIDTSNLRDGYLPGESFVYKMTAQNAGGFQAQNILITMDMLAAGIVTFTDSAVLFTAPSAAGPWTQQQSVAVGASSVTFTAFDLPAGYYARMVIPAEAVSSGTVDVDTQLDYDSDGFGQDGDMPLEVTEETSVQ